MSAPAGAASTEPLLTARNVVKHFPVSGGGLFGRAPRLKAVDDVSFEVFPGETLGLVGETGCGKSTLARCVTRLYDLTAGEVTFEGRDISRLSRSQMRPLRREMQVIFQDPYGSLNPRRRVGSIIGDAFRIHKIDDKAGSKRRVQELMELVGLNPEHYNRFPAEFSGGQRQRIGVARALALKPKIIVCDEPVSALDVSIQAQVLNLLQELQKELGLTYIFISHDLSVVRHVSDRIAVMYLGKIVETANAETLFEESRHPYTRALLSALPPADPDAAERRERIVLSGDLPSPLNPPTGCRFHPRCPRAVDQCVREIPIGMPVFSDGPDHTTACWRPMLAEDNLTDSTPQIEGSIVGLDPIADVPAPLGASLGDGPDQEGTA